MGRATTGKERNSVRLLNRSDTLPSALMLEFTHPLISLRLGRLLHEPVDALWVELFVDLLEHRIALLQAVVDGGLDL